MKLYDTKNAPNPRRVRIFLAEKGLEIPCQEVDIPEKENQKPEFLEKNPLGLLPVLELDDGRLICESVAICRYIEELHPEPNLMGSEPFERANIERWQRHMEFEILNLTAQVFRHTHKYWIGRLPQSPDHGEFCRQAVGKRLDWLDGVLAEREYVAGDRFTIADITALVGLDFGRISKIRIMPEQKNLSRWYSAVSGRPSSKA